MHDKVREEVIGHIETMKQRHLALVDFQMTHRECIEIVARPDHIDLLYAAADVAAVPNDAAWMTVTVPFEVDGVRSPEVSFYMRTHAGQTPPLRPRFPQWRGPSADVELRVKKWIEHRLVAGRLAATTKEVVNFLAYECDTGHQIRYLYPAIMHLIGLCQGDRSKMWADKYGIFKSMKSAPALPPHMRKAIVDTSAWLTQAALLNEITVPEAGAVHISALSTMPSFKFGKYNVVRM